MPKIQTLQSLRALAALLVVFDHASLGIQRLGLFAQVPFLGLFLGSQGVAIFFIISGFIITYTADTPDDRVSYTESAAHFAKRRIARLVPLYWPLTLLVAVPAFFSGAAGRQEISAGHLLKSLFFVPYVNGHGDMVPIFLLGWTLNYEMAFYALFAVLMLMLPHRVRIPAPAEILPVILTPAWPRTRQIPFRPYPVRQLPSEPGNRRDQADGTLPRRCCIRARKLTSLSLSWRKRKSARC